jgi:uncharacterized protein (TIGR00369 family)
MSSPETDLSREQRDRIVASFEQQGLMRTIAARFVCLEHGRCSIELPFSWAVSQQHGFFHGGAIGTLADVAAGYAAMTLVGIGQDVLTVEYKINFLRPATGALLRADGQVIRAGRSIIVASAQVFDDKQRVCAVLQQTVVPAPGSY